MSAIKGLKNSLYKSILPRTLSFVYAIHFLYILVMFWVLLRKKRIIRFQISRLMTSLCLDMSSTPYLESITLWMRAIQRCLEVNTHWAKLVVHNWRIYLRHCWRKILNFIDHLELLSYKNQLYKLNLLLVKLYCLHSLMQSYKEEVKKAKRRTIKMKEILATQWEDKEV